VGLLVDPEPIETDGHVLRARRTAAVTRVAMGVLGAALTLAQPQLLPHPALGFAGFVIIGLTGVVQIAAPRLSWLSIEESLSASAGVLIIGFGSEHVTALSMMWLVALASGVLARGGRVHWVGRTVVLFALALPVLRYGAITIEYAALLVSSTGLLLTSGRLTSELNVLLKQARLEAESAETLLLAGDIAARVAERGERAGGGEPSARPGGNGGRGAAHSASERSSLERVLAGEGLSMAVQPIVDIRSETVHGYEALARFAEPLKDGSPLHWFALAEELGQRSALERACLREALDLFASRPAGTRMSVNLSVAVLLEPLTARMLDEARDRSGEGLDGLIVEITEETLVHADMELQLAIAPLLARGAHLAVDDMGAGYSGLRQITSVRPDYLKLDRSLISGIDGDNERAALVGALAGYSRQVGSMLVAEGVETEAELAVVRELGVPLVQGYFFCRPAAPWPELDTAARTPPRATRATAVSRRARRAPQRGRPSGTSEALHR
jgi:EAL domain-containing protein (putative c-di-GMP-specific phosphodiesterase class I)